MESLQWENLNHVFSRKVLFITDIHCQLLDVDQSMKQTLLYVVVSFISSSVERIDVINTVTKP
jgi:hypothetical protein